MKRMALLLMLALPGWLFAQSSDEAASKPAREPLLPLRLVYIGNGKSPRAEQFAGFLKKHFATVTIADREGFKPKAAVDADVVLFDWSQSDMPIGPAAEAPAEKWRSWWKENKPYLFFSDTGGFRWYVDPLAKARGVSTAQLRGPARAKLAAPGE